MGLDMYLVDVKTTQVGYWRKAYPIDNWFVRHVCGGNIENCQYYPVSEDDLEAIIADCDAVLAAGIPSGTSKCGIEITPEFIAEAKKRIPVPYIDGEGGYSDDYVSLLKETREQAQSCLDHYGEYTNLCYEAWW